MAKTLLKLEIGLDDAGDVIWNIDNEGDLCIHQILYTLLNTTLTLAIQEDVDFFESMNEVLEDNFDEDGDDLEEEKISSVIMVPGNDTIN
jgi:hypothetical protein